MSIFLLVTKNMEKPTSGVGAITERISNDIPKLEVWFPLPKEHPKKLSESLRPRFTDSLFMKAIYELAGMEITDKKLSIGSCYQRLTSEQKYILINTVVRKSFNILEPQIVKYPDVIETFITVAQRYTKPFPSFEIDVRYGAADLLCGTKLVEMKAYSVMTFQDLVNARNQVLTYACLMSNVDITEIEVVNSLTGEVWTWDFTEFRKTGNDRKFYLLVINPLISNPNITPSEIAKIKQIYETCDDNIVDLLEVLHRKQMHSENYLRQKIYRLNLQVAEQITTRNNIIRKYKELLGSIPNEPKNPNTDDDEHWFELTIIPEDI